jgi:hypothetical protein
LLLLEENRMKKRVSLILLVENGMKRHFCFLFFFNRNIQGMKHIGGSNMSERALTSQLQKNSA